MTEFMRVEDLVVYQKLCDLHIDVCNLSATWPADEKYELRSQLRRSSNSAPAQLAEKHSDRHVRNKIEGVNRARGEALDSDFESYRDRYQECVRMLNGLERKLESQLEPEHRRFPSSTEPRTLNPEP